MAKTTKEAAAFAPDDEIEDNEGIGTPDEGTQDTQEQKSDEGIDTGWVAPKPGKYSPHNPKNMGAVVIDIFGSKERRKRAIDMGLSDYVLPPITRKQTAKYRVIGGDQINPATKMLAEVQPIFLEGNYMFYDPGQGDLSKRQIHVRNTTGKKERIRNKQTGEEMIEEVVEAVEFLNGVKMVNVEAEWPLYVFLELHPLNASNKHRNKSASPAFERIDIQNNKSVAFMLAEEELQEEAITEVRALTKVDDINGYATNAGIPTREGGSQRNLALIKSDLRGWAFKNPRGFFALSKNTKHAIRMTVLEADSFGIIEYEADKKKWFAPYTTEPLHVVLAGNDPVMDFVSHLAKPENTPKYDAIRNMLDYWER
jgi:hypothetical protein